MAGLILALQITADGSDLRSDIKLDEAALRSLGVTAGQVETEARRASVGMGAVETSTRKAALAALAYSNQAKVQNEAVNAYGDRIDGLRGKFTPFLTIQKQYIDTRKEITEAVKIGALSEIEGARALDLNRAGYERQLNSLRAATAATRESTSAADEYSARLDATREKLNPFVALQSGYIARQKEINEAVKLGAISEIEGTRAHDLNRAGYDRQLNSLRAVTRATREQTGAIRLQGYQLANLGQQGQDVFVQLAMGTNPFMIAAQQGPQIVSAMGGVKNSLALIKPLFTTTRVAIGGVTAALATGAMAWNSYLTSVKAVETAAAGRGRGQGFTAGDLDKIAQAGAAAAGISVKSAREAEVAFLNTGKIGNEVMLKLIGLSKDYAATMGMDLAGAVADLGEKFADPAQAVASYQKSLALLDDETARYVQTLILQNRTNEAQLIIADALALRAASARTQLTMLGRAWADVGVRAANAWDKMGEGVESLFSDPKVSTRALDVLLQARARAIQSQRGSVLLEGVGIIDLEELDVEINKMRGSLEKVRREEEQKKINVLSVRAGDAARSLTPGASELDALRKQQADMRSALHDPAIAAATDGMVNVANAYGRATNAINTYLTPAQRSIESDKLATAALTARSPAAKADIAARQKTLELMGQSLTTSEREAQVAAAGTMARAQATQAITDQNNALGLNTRATLDVASARLTSAEAAQRAEARAQGLSDALQTGANAEIQTRLHLADAVAQQTQAGAQAVADIDMQVSAQEKMNDAVAIGAMTREQASVSAQRDAALAPLLIARANAEGDAKIVLTQIIDRLTAAYDRLAAGQARGAGQDIIAGQENDIARTKLEISLQGQSAQVRARALATFDAEALAKSRIIDVNSAEGRTIVSNARASADYNLILDRQNDLYGELGNFGERSLDKINDALMENGLSLKTLGDITKSVIADMMTEFLKLAALNPLKNALFGTNYGTLGDAGGFVGSLFSGTYHTGGIVGDGSSDNRILPVSALTGAPRFHNGGLVSGERVIIAKDEEEVLTADNPRHIRNINQAANAGASGGFGAGGGAPIVNVTHNIYEAPGTKTTTKTTDDGKGNLTIDTIVVQIEDKMAARGKGGQGALFPAIGNKFGLNPNAGRPRSGK